MLVVGALIGHSRAVNVEGLKDYEYPANAQFLKTSEVIEHEAQLMMEKEGCPLEECRQDVLAQFKNEEKTWDDSLVQIKQDNGTITECVWEEAKPM